MTILRYMSATQTTFAPEIQSRLDSFGKFHLHIPSLIGRWLGAPGEIEWEEPIGFKNDLAPATAALWFSWGKRRDDELHRLLATLETFRTRLADHIAELKTYVVDSFRRYSETGLSDDERQRLCNSDGSISEAAILRDVRSLHLRFYVTSTTVIRTAWLDVPWDEEHGLEAEWDETGKLTCS